MIEGSYNYCTRCGNELDDREVSVAKESDAPPFCYPCAVELMTGIIRPMAKFYAEMEKSINEAFRPMVEALSMNIEEGDDDG